MRDPQRIPEMLELIARIWLANPDLRLGQLIMKTQPTRATGDGAVNYQRMIEEIRLVEDGVVMSRLLDTYCRADGMVERIPSAQATECRCDYGSTRTSHAKWCPRAK